MLDAEFELEAELNKLMRVLERSDLESEIAESEGEGGISLLRGARDVLVITRQGGERDENKLADAVFYDRHPDWKGRVLKNAPLALRKEWMEIRDNVVRPYLRTYPARPPATPAPSPPAAPPAAGEQFGFSQFANTRQYEPYKYPQAIAAQNDYLKVSGFLPYYKKISIAWPQASISLDPHGVGNLVFSMNGRAFTDFVESEELRNKALEMLAGHISEVVFTVDVIGMLGLGLTLLDIANGLEKERMLGGVGPEYDKWRAKQQLQFTFALAAEDLTRTNWGNLEFINHDPRSLAVELANRYAEFQPIFSRYSDYFQNERNLGIYQGHVPDRMPDVMGPAPPGM